MHALRASRMASRSAAFSRGSKRLPLSGAAGVGSPALLRAAEDHDLVLGSRYVEGGGTENWGLVRQALSRGGSAYTRSILHLPVKDPTTGFKCFRREVLDAVDLNTVTTTGYAFQIELTYRAWKLGFRIKEVPIVFYERENGRSKMSGDIVREAVTAVWKMRFG